MYAEVKYICAMMIFGTVGIFVKNISLSAGEIALFRALIGTGAILIYQFLWGRNISFRQIKSDLPWLLASGIAMGVNWIFLFEAYHYTSISLATLCYYFAPVIVMMICPILFKEKLGLKQSICFIMSTVGLVLIIGVSLGEAKNHFLGILFGLGAAIFYATVVLLNKYIKKVMGVERTLLQFIAAIFVLLPYVCFSNGIHVRSLDGWGIFNLIFLGVIHTGFTYCLYLSSIKMLTGQKIALMSYIDPIFAIIISSFLLNETMSFLQIIGGGLILGFTLLSEIDVSSLIRLDKYIRGSKKL